MPIETPIIFISYARKDVAIVRELYEKLKRSGYRPWLDLEDLNVGDEWEIKVRETLEKTPLFISCLSTHSVSHEGVVQWEIRQALEIANRKIDVYFLPVRLNDCRVPTQIKKYQWVDLFAAGGFEKLLAAIREGFKRRGLVQSFKLRSEPIENLTYKEAGKMIRERGFFDNQRNWEGRGLLHQYQEAELTGAKLVVDHTTGLTWQGSGSDEAMTFEKAQDYIKQLNRKKFAGYADWRLPTLEEVMSLMEPKKHKGGLYVNPIFDTIREFIFTADTTPAAEAWVVDFSFGFCFYYRVDFYGIYVRAVHSGTVTI